MLICKLCVEAAAPPVQPPPGSSTQRVGERNTTTPENRQRASNPRPNRQSPLALSDGRSEEEQEEEEAREHPGFRPLRFAELQLSAFES